jgi:hypothetical protein
MLNDILIMNPDEQDASPRLADKILEFQSTNEDKAVEGTAYSSYFIDVQLKSLHSYPDGFSVELFDHLLGMTVDPNICAHIWRNYQDLLVDLLNRLDTNDDFEKEVPELMPYFLKLLSRILYAQADLNSSGKLIV